MKKREELEAENLQGNEDREEITTVQDVGTEEETVEDETSWEEDADWQEDDGEDYLEEEEAFKERAGRGIKKGVPVLIALILIAVIAIFGFGKKTVDKYSYGTEMADLDEYFGVTGGELAIVLQDEKISSKAHVNDNQVYFDIDTVMEYFNEGFYVDYNEQKLLYTTAVDTITVVFGAGEYSDGSGVHGLGYVPCYQEGDTLYLAAEYIKRFTNYSYEQFDRHLQVYTEWGNKQVKEITSATQVRIKGGIKSPILREIAEGETVEILEEMETWTKVKTSDSLIGYVENKRMGEAKTVTEMAVADYVPEEYTSISMPGKVSLGWHYIGGLGGNATLDNMVAEGKGMNVIAPTWFSLTDNEGNYRSFADTSYVKKAQGYGLQVWAVWDNFNYKNETGAEVDSLKVLSSTTVRQKLVQSMVEASLAIGVEGINIDFESLNAECGVHYIQFLKELSVLCRKVGLVLSVDNYVPFNFNNYYRLDIQGQIADYVIIMGYDEHWHGSGDPGSVASISYVSNGLDRTLEQVPKEKVVNALAFYTILWKTDGVNVTDEYITLVNQSNFMSRVGVKAVWDEETCQNYAEWKSGSTLYQIWLEDSESIKVKLNVMNTKGIAGVAVWRLGYGTPEIWELLKAYKDL